MRNLLLSARNPQRRDDFLAGFRTMLPAATAIAAWGMVTGIALAKTLPLPVALGMSLLVFAGSAQLAALPLLAAQLPLWTVLFAAAVVNLRFVIFSAALQPHFKTLPLRRRLLFGYLNGDVNFVLFLQRHPVLEPAEMADLDERQAYFLGLALCNWSAWQLSSLLGILLAAQIPMAWGLDFAGMLALLAIAVPMVVNRAGALAVLAAALVTVWGLHWPYKLNLVAAVSAAMLVGVLYDELSVGGGRRREETP